MGIGTSIFLIAVGAILRYAVKDSFDAIDLQVVGLILMIVGVIGLAISLLYMNLWARGRVAPPPGGRTHARDGKCYWGRGPRGLRARPRGMPPARTSRRSRARRAGA